MFARARVQTAAALALLLLAGCARIPNTEGRHSAVTPEPRKDEWWAKRHASMNARVELGNVDLVFIGDSITQGWEGDAKVVWDQYYGRRNAVNLGISGDRTQHVVWRLRNGNLKGIAPKAAVVMIGTNNHKDNSAEEIADGVKLVVREIREASPKTKILLLAIFPRSEKPDQYREKLAAASAEYKKIAGGKVTFLDIGPAFLEPDGSISKAIMPDFLHLSPKGYEIWAKEIEPTLAKLLGETK